MVPVVVVVGLKVLSRASEGQAVAVEVGVLAPDARFQRPMLDVGTGFAVVTPM